MKNSGDDLETWIELDGYMGNFKTRRECVPRTVSSLKTSLQLSSAAHLDRGRFRRGIWIKVRVSGSLFENPPPAKIGSLGSDPSSANVTKLGVHVGIKLSSHTFTVKRASFIDSRCESSSVIRREVRPFFFFRIQLNSPFIPA